MVVQPVDGVGLARVTQLINKTNQFNLVTRRLTEAQVAAMMRDPSWVTMQVRLADRFGDNGVIAVVTARVSGSEAVIEDWLMSCRVLGRRVEEACLQALVEMVKGGFPGVKRLVGTYRATEKNGMVQGMYPRLGFAAAGEARWTLEVGGYRVEELPIEVDVLREALV
jgi:FkbH-like protein